jgi:hypothetical protein
MKKFLILSFAVVLVFGVMPNSAHGLDTENYGDVTLSGVQAGHFADWWDLTQSNLVISFTYDANGLVDDFGGSAHAWAELGVRSPCDNDFNPTSMAEGSGVWLSTDYAYHLDTFDGNADDNGNGTVNADEQDLDDKLILQKGGGLGEGSYNLPSTPLAPGNNHRVWFDRDGVDQWQALNPLAIDGDTYNTGGIYEIVITLHANDATSGTAYMTINGLDQGFETNSDWTTMELTPAGMTFTGDMEHLRVFYGIWGYGATHSVAFEDIEVEGHMGYPPLAPCFERDIDIKPGSYPNSINLASRGRVAVAVLTTASFDATTVDPDTVTFAGASPVRWSVEDVDSDGDLDLVFHFKTLELSLDENSTDGVLQGDTFDPVFFWGEDSVNIVPMNN